MAALEIFDIIFYKYMRRIARICFVDVTDENFRVTIGTYSFAGSILFGLMSLLYTAIAQDFETALNSGSGWGIAVQVSCKKNYHRTAINYIPKIGSSEILYLCRLPISALT